jgi:hypothetical protein
MFNEFFKYASDYEFALRVHRNYRIDNLNELLYKYRYHNDNITANKREEQLLYDILAKRIANNNLDFNTLNTIKKCGICSLYNTLDKKGLMYFYNGMANTYIYKDKRLALKYYIYIFKINPFDIINLYHICSIYIV